MLTAHTVLPHGHWSGPAADHITLDHDARHRRRWVYTADHGTLFLLDLARATVLGHGDALQLSDGRLVEVLAAPEALVEVTATDPSAMIRLAWHIGNRHLPAELHPHAIRLRDDHVINAMLHIEVDPETYEVRADGELLTCEPASVLPFAQRYFLF